MAMALFDRLIKQGDTVIEVGGHIGYVSLYLSSLVANRSNTGHVYVFEPGANNQRYITKNLTHLSNVTLISKAVCNTRGKLPFYIEEMTGMNNTLVQDYSIFKENMKASFLRAAYEEVLVDAIRMDDFVNEQDIRPSFVKIDVEGAELDVLNGMLSCLTVCKPLLMIEMTRNQKDVRDILIGRGYVMIDSGLRVMDDYREMYGNIFCFHREAHATRLKDLGIDIDPVPPMVPLGRTSR